MAGLQGAWVMSVDHDSINRAAELGMLAGQDLAKALERFSTESPAPATTTLRQFLRENIGEIIAAFDDHEAGLEDWRSPVVFRCACGFRGIREEWEQHVAERIALKFDDQTELTLL